MLTILARHRKWRGMELMLEIQPKGPQLCSGEEKMKTISATVGETKTVSICVMAYPGLGAVTFNGTRIYRNQTHPKFDVVYKPTELKKLYYTVIVTLKDVTTTDYGLLKVGIQTTEMEEMVYNLTLKPKEIPRIRSFQIAISSNGQDQLDERNKYEVVILSQDYLVMTDSDMFLSLTCQASGILLSDVEIVQSETGKTQVSHSVPFTYQKPSGACDVIASFACKATNIFNDFRMSKSVEIRAECKAEITEFQVHPSTFDSKSENGIVLKCEATGYPPPDLQISKLGIEESLTYIKGQKVLEHQWNGDMQCDDMGTYTCTSKNEFNELPMRKTFDLNIGGCSPQLCPWEARNKTVHVEIGQTPLISICLVSSTFLYPHDTVSVNGHLFKNGQDNGKFLVEYQADEENDMYYKVNLTVRNISMDDYGQVNVKIWSHYQTETEWNSKSLEYNINLAYEENPIEDEIVDFVGEEIIDDVGEEIVDFVGEQIPAGVSESPVDYVGENLDMWETLQTECKWQKIEELFITAKKLLDKALDVELCNVPHSSRRRMEVFLYLVNCVLDGNDNI